MSVKLLVIYPTPTDAKEFDHRHTNEHLPMGKKHLVGATKLASYKVLGSPTGPSPYHNVTEATFATLGALQAAAATEGAQATIKHAHEISSGGPPTFMIIEEE
jgi:uncharacterized protein (TIGR02118 family)